MKTETRHPTTDAHAYCCGGDHGSGTSYEIKSPIGGAVPTGIAQCFEVACREALARLETIRTDNLAVSGFPKEASSISAARVALREACLDASCPEADLEAESALNERVRILTDELAGAARMLRRVLHLVEEADPDGLGVHTGEWLVSIESTLNDDQTEGGTTTP